MLPLDKTLRNKLEKTVKAAREVAEIAAKTTLEQLGVGDANSPAFLSDAQKELRRKLRIHGRQLGDYRSDKAQSIEILTEEIAYEHWHRMLFARFLAENNLLMDDDPNNPVAVSLEECEELAPESGAASAWELAAQYASRMLPQIFRTDSPVFQLSLPPENQHELENLLADLPPETFQASDALGWVYQFWQTKKKEDVNKSGVKIGARELPAVTQLFTEPYMVSFLLDNSLGAWWASKVLTLDVLDNAETEEDLRKEAAIPGVVLKYLRFIKSDGNSWKPAGGWYEQWNQEVRKLRILDPCCGSGHFLVSTLLMLVPMRMRMEGISASDAIDRVLKDNIYGLEIDKRCVEIAVFALALTAWTYPESGGYRKLPQMNIACCGLSVGVAKDEWAKLANGNVPMRQALNWLYDFCQDAPVLGSLLNPKKDKFGEHLRINFPDYSFDRLLDKVKSIDEIETGLAAKGLLDANHILLSTYDLVITNVPYLARNKQDNKLRNYCEQHYPAAKNDLANVFLDRCLELCNIGGTACIVLPQNWTFLINYRHQREYLLHNNMFNILVKLGGGAESFNDGPGNITNICMITLTKSAPTDFEKFSFINVSEFNTPSRKSEELIMMQVISDIQNRQLENPDFRIATGIGNENLLEKIAICPRGVVSGDVEKYVRSFWEISQDNCGWKYFQGTVTGSDFYTGRDKIIDWSTHGKGLLRAGVDNLALGKDGVNVSLIGNLPTTLYTGDLYDQTTASIIIDDPKNLSALYCYCTSQEFLRNVRAIDQKLNVTPATLLKVTFDQFHFIKEAEEKYPNGLPKPYSNDSTQWIFHGHPSGSVAWSDDSKQLEIADLRTDNAVLQVAVAKLLGYKWPAETDNTMELSEDSRYWVQESSKLNQFADEDGIVCIPSVRGEESATDRVIKLLAAAYDDRWSNSILEELLISCEHAGKSLETWLRDKFFVQHCKMFNHRPFIWQIWDGLRDGFSVLVNYHKFDNRKLQSLIYSYLGDWITKQKRDIDSSFEGAQEKLAAAENLKKKLELILEGEEPYDIFVRWKPLEKQPIGWNPDLNDGVRMNIRPFVTAEVLRINKKPQLNISWDKDRGKDVPSAPWYHLDQGNRINDRHLSLKDKK